MQVHVTGALLDTMDDAIRIVGTAVHGNKPSPEANPSAAPGLGSAATGSAASAAATAAGGGPAELVRGEEEQTGDGRIVRIVHKYAQTAGLAGAGGSQACRHEAFVLRNLTGASIRVFQPIQRVGTADAASALASDQADMG